ncbi:zinc finger protein ZFMSA12A-like [Notolabrus celidotus]|uniref:zinc finger protein ZFMSA12A-like n=1 Tax=Notolabrus celidotus TaxID=1203425 RepID=UPI0014905F16|nr:zinc finger protein ZFMSA12A-like [Notolabrus celidotus]
MEGMSAFQSQLSSIMEKLVVSAVTEINQLMCEYCAVLQVQLSRETQDNITARETLQLQRPVSGFMQGSLHGTDETRPPLQEEQVKSGETTEEQKQRTVGLVDCKLEPITVCDDPEDQPRLSVAPPVHSDTCSQSGEICPHPTGQRAQFCSEPPEASKDLNADYNPSVEMQCRLRLSPSGAQFSELGFHIKREVESPDLQTQGEDVNLGFELQQGNLCHMYSESGAFTVDSTQPDTQMPSCFSSLQSSENQLELGTLNMPEVFSNRQDAADGEAYFHQFSKRRTVQYRTPGRFKCDFCGKGFPFLSMMKGHRISHTRERNQVCGQCGKTFIRRSHLKRHEMLHAGIMPFICQVCGQSFARRAQLGSHMKTHSM